MKSARRILILLQLLLLHFSALAQNSSLGGSITDRNNQQPLAGITVSIPSISVTTLSDSLGRFRFTGINPGSYSISITGVGYQEKLLTNIVLTTGNETWLAIEMEPAAQKLEQVTISSRKSSARATTIESPLSVQRLTTEDIRANPGGNFDISKVIQSLPGVGGGAAGGSFRNDIIIRGGAPSENVYYLDGIEVPIINHFSTQGSGGGPQGILNVSFIQDVTLSTSAFDARYDNALSSVFQFRQKNGNPNRLQGNIRLSGTELAATFDGPLSQKTTFLASARRSYLQVLFQLLDLPIRPNYWDFQFKTTTRISEKLTINTIGIGAIDAFRFAAPKEATPEKLYLINSGPLVNQWSYTAGVSLRGLLPNGFWNLAISRNTLDNQADKYLDNNEPSGDSRTLNISSRETENKIRLDFTRNPGAWKFSYGIMGQLVEFNNAFFQVLRPEIRNEQGQVLQDAILFSQKREKNFIRYGGFVQAGRRLLAERLAISAGLRADANNLSNSESNPLKQLSPRISASYALDPSWNISASYGLYYRLPGYPQLAFSNGVMNPGQYISSRHWVAGIEFLPSSVTRFTLEGFYKNYGNYPISIPDGISLANKGREFGAIGNEPVVQTGKGRAYGLEFFAQQKLTDKFFGVASYTLYWSSFTGLDGNYKPSAWDNRHLLSITTGYKLPRNWEVGLKFRYQGAAPFTPYDPELSRINFLTLGTGIFDYSMVNSLRLPAFHAGDIRIDKKWNFRRFTLDLFLDVQNFYAATSADVPQYSFRRNNNNSAFLTTDGQPLRNDGSNAIPVLLDNREGTVLPTIGFIVEF